MPLRSRMVERSDLTGCGPAQLQLQQVREQPVVAEPRPRRVQRHYERVRLLQLLQDPLAALVSGQQIGELAIDLFQDRRSQQQPPHLLALPLQYLGQQVVPYRPLPARKLSPEPTPPPAPRHRQPPRSTPAPRTTTGAPPRPPPRPAPAAVGRSAPSTDSQTRCGSRRSPRAESHPALSLRLAARVHDPSTTASPLPGGAEITVTRADA